MVLEKEIFSKLYEEGDCVELHEGGDDSDEHGFTEMNYSFR